MPICLSETARARISCAWREIAALAALAELASLLDTDGARGRWWVAGELAARLSRFQGAAYHRIAAGHRPVQDRIEGLLLVVLRSNLPTSRRRLYDLLN